MKKVFIVDDEVDICKLLAMLLKRLGVTADYAVTIQDAKGRVIADDYDVIFIDLNLPDGSGYDLIQHLKEHRVTAKMIVISAYSFDSKRVHDNGVDYFLPKPFTSKAVEGVLKKLEVIKDEV